MMRSKRVNHRPLRGPQKPAGTMRSNCGSENAGQLGNGGVTKTKIPPPRKTPDNAPRASGSKPERTSQISASDSWPNSIRARSTPSDLTPSGAPAPIHTLVSAKSAIRGSIRVRLQVSSPARITQRRWCLATAAARTADQKRPARAKSLSAGDRGDTLRTPQLALTHPAGAQRRRPGRCGRVQSRLASNAEPPGANRWS